MKIKLPVTWEQCGEVVIDDPSVHTIQEAIDFFNEHQEHLPLPNDSAYVDGSFMITDNDPEVIVSMTGQKDIPLD